MKALTMDPVVGRDRMAGGGRNDPEANIFEDELHQHLQGYSNSELIDLVWDLIQEPEPNHERLEHILLGRYLNLHPRFRRPGA
jgi:hypothetical protein